MNLLRGIIDAIKRILGLSNIAAANSAKANEPKSRSKIAKHKRKVRVAGRKRRK